MLLPPVILVLVFSYGPMAGIVIAFQDFVPANGWFNSPWIGLDNFKYVLDFPDVRQVLWNTFFIAVLKIAAGTVCPIILALSLNEVKKTLFKRGIQTIVYLPHFMSWVLLAGILIDILSPSGGIINNMLQALGMQPIYFLGDGAWFRATLIISNVWKEVGFDTIVYLAAIVSIDRTQYESAVLDGAGYTRQMWHITLPGIRGIIILLMLLNIGSILNAGFDQIFNLYSPQVYDSADILDTFVYRIGMEEMQYGVATAVGLFKSIVSFVLITLSYYLAYKVVNYRIF
ncbi:ABC transporter permease subunit [Paenibacillus pasadenensis]|uniref:ABC transporter permease n=1 Tax=Paenibacillus pasadenensis TaxID=217090 RepID=UPI00203D31F3|nr:ABC transporter permease subunit [Paenibacillus pasadenensis]MCM3745736.1 ABC transporter permease subunit [Paenibacillus pasadenensis]